MASLLSSFCFGKGGNEITIESKDIDCGKTKESPSKLKPIKAEAATNNKSSGKPLKVKNRKKHWRCLKTCRTCFPMTPVLTAQGLGDRGDGSEYEMCVVQTCSVNLSGLEDGRDGTKNDWIKMQILIHEEKEEEVGLVAAVVMVEEEVGLVAAVVMVEEEVGLVAVW